MSKISQEEQQLHREISTLISQSQTQLIAQANSSLTMLFWQIGKRTNEFILKKERAAYGKQMILNLSRYLSKQYGRNFEEKNLRRMLQQKTKRLVLSLLE
ncbi:MAG: DUF1016 domain-containing protein [Cytophagales bacterium]|nr:DUF1016 domain-containing protein [Cytophagales bacterium]